MHADVAPALVSNLETLLRLLLAAGLGSIIGIERERLQWAAGLRTHMLVCVGSALFMLVSMHGFADVLGTPAVALDPSRVAAQVVSGIGFLGAGTILLRRDRIRGLTTAASLWTVAAIGLAVGGGLYVEAVGGTVVIFAILAGVKPLERRFWASRQGAEIAIVVERERASLAMLESMLTTAGIAIREIDIAPAESPDDDEIRVRLGPAPDDVLLASLEKIRRLAGVRSVRMTDPKKTPP